VLHRVDSWISGAAISGACSCVDWFRNGVSPALSYDELESRAADQESAPVFLPFVFGERCPGWHDERKGGFEDISAEHGLGALYRGVLEGVCFNLKQCYDLLIRLLVSPLVSYSLVVL